MFLYPGREDLAVVDFDQEYASNNLSNKMRKRQYWMKDQTKGLVENNLRKRCITPFVNYCRAAFIQKIPGTLKSIRYFSNTVSNHPISDHLTHHAYFQTSRYCSCGLFQRR